MTIYICKVWGLPGADPHGCDEHRDDHASTFDRASDDESLIRDGGRSEAAERDPSINRILTLERNSP